MIISFGPPNVFSRSVWASDVKLKDITRQRLLWETAFRPLTIDCIKCQKDLLFRRSFVSRRQILALNRLRSQWTFQLVQRSSVCLLIFTRLSQRTLRLCLSEWSEANSHKNTSKWFRFFFRPLHPSAFDLSNIIFSAPISRIDVIFDIHYDGFTIYHIPNFRPANLLEEFQAEKKSIFGFF